jgi:FkbM family methyltransferase
LNARLGHHARRGQRALRTRSQRWRKRLARSWWLRDSPLAVPLTGTRFALGLYFDDLEKVLHALSRDRRDVFVIQVGACEAAVGDPLGWFLRARSWRGVLVEPVPYLFERMQHNCTDLPGVRLENSAIAAEAGEATFYYIEPGEGDRRPEIYKTLGSFRRENLERHAHFIARFEERVIARSLPCLPLDALCRKHAVERLDLLICDAEGYDFEVLKTLDFERTPPRLVVWEHQHLSPEDAQACRRYLQERGYAVRGLSKDSVALHRERDGGELGSAFRSLG